MFIVFSCDFNSHFEKKNAASVMHIRKEAFVNITQLIY